MLLVTLFCQSQEAIKGVIVDQNSNPIPEAAIQVVELENVGVITNFDGEFTLSLPEGSYTLKTSFVGFKTQLKKINVRSKKESFLKIILQSDIEELEGVFITSKTKAQKLRETSYAIEVIETKPFKNLSTNGNEILSKVPGINIRQSGGLGSDFTLSLNGLTDNQVRVFIDGVPMDYFGSSLSLNNFSANLIEQIEVYKGVVPIHLSSDALGGAINVVTNQKNKSFLDVSYGFGSFNTHIISVNGQYRDENSGFTGRLNSFYNYSDNNYKIDIKLIDDNTGREDEFATEVERFHDAYTSKMVWLEAGYTGTKFADKLLFGVLISDNSDEIQFNPVSIGDSNDPYGEVLSEEEAIISNFSYSKKGLFTDELSLNAYLVNVIGKETFRDISDFDYSWDRTREIRSAVGLGETDLRKTELILNKDNLLGNFNSEFAFNEKHNIAANYSLNSFRLSGRDRFNTQNQTQFSTPSRINKQVLALSYTNSLFNSRLSTTAFVKYYDYSLKSLETNFQGDTSNNVSVNKSFYGFGIATNYRFTNFQVKASFENTLRFPEIIELFGDGDSYRANPALQPETSENYNLGFIYSKPSSIHSFSLSLNGFYRNVKKLIDDEFIGNIGFFENKDSAIIQGIDFSSIYNYKNKWILNLSATYLSKKNNDEFINGERNVLFDARFPNEPYLFGNFYISYNKNDLFTENDSFSITVNENYRQEFFFIWENLADSDTKAVVPEQWTTDLNFVYGLKNNTYNFSLGINNLLDEKIFDRLFQQRPGRSINFKIRYFLN